MAMKVQANRYGCFGRVGENHTQNWIEITASSEEELREIIIRNCVSIDSTIFKLEKHGWEPQMHLD